MRYRVTSDGTDFGTRVTNADTGEEIWGVFKVEFIHDGREIPELVLHMYARDVDVDVIGEAKILTVDDDGGG